MKKIITLLAAFAMITAIVQAQESVASTPIKMSEEEMGVKLQPLYQKLQEMPQDENTDANLKKIVKEFLDENHNEAGVYVLQRLGSTMTEESLNYINNVEYFKNNPVLQEQKVMWLKLHETGEGSIFKDFQTEHEGKVVKLSDYVGKGKYVLVDFWASWCGPCRMEIPNLIKVYNQYKGDKFEVLGVATWDKPEDTKKAIKELGIPYPQILNASKEVSDAYGIVGIPHIILFDPDGKIVKRNLRGSDIERTVKKALQQESLK